MSETKIASTKNSKTVTGTTFKGEKFLVPTTYDMVRALFDPTLHKSLFELIIIVLLSTNAIIYFFTPESYRIPLFIAIYFFWRVNYNYGIGVLLYKQSNYNQLVTWSTQLNLFKPEAKDFKLGWFQRLINYEIRSKMGPNYKITEHPIEFNTWLIFRKYVDLILMQDFTAFMFLVLSCATYQNNYKNQVFYLTVLRWVIGWTLILFNLWVKVNAHNTVKDYAWYWGDFFFLQDTELTFDGVFEMVPHPMYSIGYIGYYGFALISKSYTVLIVSLIAHFLQMVFLIFVENPHIDKIYPSPVSDINKNLSFFENLKPLIGFKNFHWSRSSDFLNLVLAFYSIVLPIFVPLNSKWNFIFFTMALAIKLLESVIIDTVLFNQSNYRSWTKEFLKKDNDLYTAFNSWCIFYNSFLNLTYFAFISLAAREYLSEETTLIFPDWYLLRYILGILLITLQIWTNYSIVESIGYFGWFYGDFFIPLKSKKLNLTNVGIYRYLNNPEKVLGISGILGVFLIVPTFHILVISGIWVLNNFILINVIEKPHMIQLYGVENVIKDSGVSKTIKKHLIPEKLISKFADEEISYRDSKINKFLKELHNLNLENSYDKEAILNLSNEFINKSEYSITILNLKNQTLRRESITSAKTKSANKKQLYYETHYINIGEPIKLKWNAPANHTSKDWIGLYKVVNSGRSRHRTLISSYGHWLGISKNAYHEQLGEGIIEESDTEGIIEFRKNKLYWEEGIYEFRYHSSEEHNVCFITEPFEIKSTRIRIPDSLNDETIGNLSKSLLLLVFNKVLPDSNLNVDDVLNKYRISDNEITKLNKLVKASTNIDIDFDILIPNDISILKLSEKLISHKQILDRFGTNNSIN